MSRAGSRLAPVSNWIARSAPARWLNEQLIGIDRRRVPPPWVRQTFSRTFAARGPNAGAAADVLLFNDTFTNFYSPQIGTAGADLLEAAGLRVGLAPNGCCGRPLISQGLLAEARERAAANTEALYPLAETGRWFVFFEPSCLSAMLDDAPALLRGDARRKATRVAEQCLLFEEVLDRQWQTAAGHRPMLRPGPTTIVLHGHCHQKSMGKVGPTRSVLARIPGAELVDPDAGCCGMAGSFGYMREHFDVSRTIAERKLLPVVRNQKPGTVIVATGTSCRAQVEDLAGVQALHPAELLRSLAPETL
jgi:Fe-S oxidoreductase